MRGVTARRIVLWAAATASLVWGQVPPVISSLQSSYLEGLPQDVTAITSGTSLQGGFFKLYINGAFNVNAFVSVQWRNLATNVTTTFTAADGTVTPTQIMMFVPNELYATVVTSPVPVTITVQQTTGSAQAAYAINPPPAPLQPFLPAGTVNVPYSTPYFTGGTGPFYAAQITGTLPPGLTADTSTISGTPTQTGVFNFQTFARDFWGNPVQGDDTIEIVAVPTISQVTPGNSGTGAGNQTIGVDGTNFVDAVVFGSQTLPGSTVQWKANGVLTPLVTTFVSSTRLTAIVPSALLATPVNAALAVQQPSPASSQAVAFAVLAPTISTIVPTGVPAGSNTTPLTVNGANYTTNGSNSPTVTLNGIPLVTNFVNSGQLTASIPSNLLLSPALSPTVTVASNQNPSSVGQTVTFTAKVATPTTGAPTGTVSFKDGTATLAGNLAISGAGTATFTTSALTAGSHSITAVYSGDAGFAPNTSAALNQVVIAGSTGMTLSVTPEVPLLGGTATYKVMLTTAGTPPLGSVTISEGATLLCTIAALTAGATSSTGACSVPYDNSNAAHGAGTHNLTAAFAPSPAYAAATAVLSVTVVSATATASKPSSSAGDIYDYGFATMFTSIVSPSVANPAYTGVVNFYDNGVLIASATPSSSTGIAASPSVLLTSGSHSITAQYSGDLFYATSAVSAALPVTVNVSIAKPYIVQVTNPGGSTSNTVPFFVLPPGISLLSPVSASAGSPNLALTLTGVNFLAGSQVLFRDSTLTPSAVASGTMTVTIPAALLTTPGLINVQVVNPGGTLSNFLPFTVIGSLSITTTALPSGVAGGNYSAALAARGGVPPYTWSATGFPPALFMNAGTGVLSGVLQVGGTYTVSVVVTDAARSSASALFALVVSQPPPPVTITPSGAGLPAGTVGVAYSGFVSATGGASPYNFSVRGNLPDGLTLSSGGAVTGTPKTPGSFSFAVVVTDANGVTGSLDTGITIHPAPLTVNGPTTPAPPVVGTPATITFTGSGGVAPYRFTPCAAPPPGLTFNGGVLSGTPTTAGAFAVCVVLADSTGATVTARATLAITDTPPPPAKLTLGGALDAGKVGVAYSGQITATGGTGPYTYSGSGLPDGLSLSASGGISGTPTTDGQFSLSASVADSKGASAAATFSLTITPADITILTGSLPDGVVGAAYSVALSASGGNKAYTWTVSGLPDGLSATAAGVISGTPKTAGTSTVTVSVQDSTGNAGVRRTTLSLTIRPPALTIGANAAPNGTVGTAYSLALQVSGGNAPYTFSAAGLPASLSISAAGVISGIPAAPGTSTFVVTVKDAAGATATRSFTLTVGLPPAPPLTFSGVTDTSAPLQQPRLQVSLGSVYPVDVLVTLTLTFAADSGPDDPAIQFSSGGRTARITVPAGATAGATDVGIQTGSVAGLITITSQLLATGQDVTPSPVPRRTIRIAAAAPVIVSGSVTAVRNASGFTVTLSGYVTDREMTQAIFTFSGSNLQTTTLTVSIDALFAQYFGSAAAAATGSQFTFTQPFTVTGSTQSITSVTVTLVNRIGQSAAVTANL